MILCVVVEEHHSVSSGGAGFGRREGEEGEELGRGEGGGDEMGLRFDCIGGEMGGS